MGNVLTQQKHARKQFMMLKHCRSIYEAPRNIFPNPEWLNISFICISTAQGEGNFQDLLPIFKLHDFISKDC